MDSDPSRSTSETFERLFRNPPAWCSGSRQEPHFRRCSSSREGLLQLYCPLVDHSYGASSSSRNPKSHYLPLGEALLLHQVKVTIVRYARLALVLALTKFSIDRLPEIRKVVNEGFVETQSRIDDLPPPPSTDPLSEMMQLLQAYRSDLDAYVAGSQGFESLIKDKNRIQAVFADNIRETRPRLYPFTEEHASQLPKDLIQKSPVLIDCSDSSSFYSSEKINDFVLTLNLNDVTERIERYSSLS